TLRTLLKKFLRYVRFVSGLLYRHIPGHILDITRTLSQLILKTAASLIPILLSISGALIIYTIGFEDFSEKHPQIYSTHQVVLLLLCVLVTARFIVTFRDTPRWRARTFNFLLVVLVFYLRSLSEKIPTLEEGSASMITSKLVFFAGLFVLVFIEV